MGLGFRVGGLLVGGNDCLDDYALGGSVSRLFAAIRTTLLPRAKSGTPRRRCSRKPWRARLQPRKMMGFRGWTMTWSQMTSKGMS